ncbi:MAG TPA: carboxypeptidase-like regulatory domain-containing protein [Planctomycetota bacterium]|nr:carboxypeptidase-like regulatory domain-containing protein [Planctomycetota bacterium]
MTPNETASTPVPDESEPVAESRVTLDVEEPEPELRLARVHGRFVLAGGRPAAGVEVRMRGWQGNHERVMAHGLPETWEDPSTTSDLDGRFAIELDPPRAFQFVLEAELKGHSGASWRWSEIAPGADLDLGTVELSVGGTVVVRMVNAQGEPIRSGWTVYGDSIAPISSPDSDAVRRMADLDPASGVARLEDLPPGLVKLRAYSRISNWINGSTVEVVGQEVLEATIRYAGPDESRRIVVVPFTRPFHTQNVSAEAIHLSGNGIEPRSPNQIAGSSQSYAFNDLEPGTYSVEIDDPRFEPWSQHGVQPGTRLDARLRGSAGVQLSVVDASTGEGLLRYDLRLRFDGSNWRPNEFQLLAPTVEPPADGIFTGLPATEGTLVVAAEGYTTLELPLGELAPGESRLLVARMERGAVLRGRVVLEDGSTPVAAAEVRLMRQGEAVSLVRAVWTSDGDVKPISAQSDGEGRFEFPNVQPGIWALHGIVNHWLVATLEPLELSEGEERQVVITLPLAGTLRGKLIGPAGSSCQALKLLLRPQATAVIEDPFDDEGIELTLRADGHFESGPLPAGKVLLVLRAPMVMLPRGFRGSFGVPGPEMEAATVEIEAGHVREVELDLSERWFGSLRALATRAGKPLAGYVVEAHSSDPENRSRSGAVTGADGSAVLSHLPPGEWIVSVRPVEGAWSVEAPGSVLVRAGLEAECSVDVFVVPGEVRLIERATGEPMAKRMVWLRPQGGSMRAHTTDAEGRLSIELAPGSYGLNVAPSFPREFTAHLEWTHSGPTTPTLEIDVPTQDD